MSIHKNEKLIIGRKEENQEEHLSNFGENLNEIAHVELDESFLVQLEDKEVDLFEEDKVPVLVPKEKKKKSSKKKPKAEKKEKKEKDPYAETTWAELEKAHVVFDNAKQFAHQRDQTVQWTAAYPGLSMNQKIKRAREADRRKGFQKKLAAVNTEPLEGELAAWSQEEFQHKAEEFLALSVDDFKIANDEEFANNIEHNFQLYEQADLIGRQLENVVSKKITVKDELRSQILKKIGEFREIGWWMKCKRDVMSDPLYAVLFKEDLKDYRKILAQMEGEDGTAVDDLKEGFRKQFYPIRDFLRKVREVDDCAFVRSKFVKEKSKAEVLTVLNQKAEEYAKKEAKALKGREKAATEKALRESWRDEAKAATGSKTKNEELFLDPEFTNKKDFDKAVQEFLALDLNALKFDTVENILKNVNAHDEIFRKADRMHSLLSKSFTGDHVPDTDIVLEVRARVTVLNTFRQKQTSLLKALCTDQFAELEQKAALEWVQEKGFTNAIPVQTLVSHMKTQFIQDNAKAEERIKNAFDALHPGEKMGADALSLARQNYQKNTLFWEEVKNTKERLTEEDDKNRLLCDALGYPEVDRLLLTSMRGKSKEEIHALLQKSNGDEEEQLALKKQLGDEILKNTDLSSFEINTKKPGEVLQGLAQKITKAEMADMANAAIPSAQLKAAHPDQTADLKITDNWEKELKAMADFSRDHLKLRMDLLTNVSLQGDLGTLGAFGLEDMHGLKADRVKILESINRPGEKTKEQRTAEQFFTATNRLLQNAVEIGEVKYGQAQKKASIEDSLDPVYQTYRMKEGIQGEGAVFGGIKKQIHDRIAKIDANPIYSSREDLHKLRELCIATLSDYVPEVPENTWYEMPTAVLKSIAVKKLKNDLSTEAILSIVTQQAAKEKQEQEEAREPEWSEKEKDALELIGDISEGKMDLKEILANHAEILTDLAITSKMSDAKKQELLQVPVRIEEKFTELASLTGERGKIEGSQAALFKDLNESQHELTLAELQKSKILGESGKIVAEAEELRHQMEKCDVRRKAEGLSEEDRKYYEDEYQRLQTSFTALFSSERYLQAKKETEELAKTAEYLKLQEQTANLQKKMEGISEEVDRQEQKRKELEEKIHLKEREIDELKEFEESLEEQGTDKFLPLDVFGTMAMKMAGPERKLANAVSKALSLVAEHLKKKTGEKAFKLKEIRELLQADDNELNQLLTEASGKLNEELQNTYTEATASVEQMAEFMFEDVTNEQRAFLADFTMMDSGENIPREEWNTHFYNEADKRADQERTKALDEENKKRERKEWELNQPVLEEIRKQKEEWESKRRELKKLREERFSKSMEKSLEGIIAPVSDREKELAEELKKPFSPTVKLNKVPTVEEELLSLQRERLEKEKRMKQEEKYQYEGFFVPKTSRELELERLVKPKLETGVEGLYIRQLERRYLYSYFEHEEDPVTLKTLYDRSWSLNEDVGNGQKKKEPGEGVFVRNVVQNYFKEANPADKRSMTTTLIRSLKPASKDRAHASTNQFIQGGKYFAGLLLGAGPLFQKLIQGVPEQYLMSEMKEAVKAVKSKLAPIPDDYVNQKFQEMIDKSGQKIKGIKKLRSLGAASIGQAFLCEITDAQDQKKQVVIKLLRPEAEERVERDSGVMLKCAKMTSDGMEATYRGQLSKIKEELDLKNEAKNCKDAETVYKKYDGEDGNTDTVHILKEIQAEKDYLVLDKADGITVDRYIEELEKERKDLMDPFFIESKNFKTGKMEKSQLPTITPSNIGLFKDTRLKLIRKLKELNKRQKNVQKTTEQWITESLFGNGYYHGDMHAGNLMVNDDKATVLDYGNATKLKSEQVKDIMGMSAAAMFKDPRTFLDRFLNLLPEEKRNELEGKNLQDPKKAAEQKRKFTEMKNAIRKELYDIFILGDKEQAGEKIYLGLQAIQRHGIEIPISLFSFSQSQVRLQNTLQDLNEQETDLRAALVSLDRARTDAYSSSKTGDLMLTAFNKASMSTDPVVTFKNLLSSTIEIREEDFVKELLDTSEEGQKLFEGKYMGVIQKIDRLMKGEAKSQPMYDDEEPTDIPAPVIELDAWKTDYAAFHAEWEKDPGSQKTKDLKKALRQKIEQNLFDGQGQSTGLFDDFGGLNTAVELLHDAMDTGSEEAFRKLMDIYETKILPCAALAKEIADFREAYKPRGFFGWFAQGNEEEKTEKAKAIFRKFKPIRDTFSDQNETISQIRMDLNTDLTYPVSETTPEDVYEVDVKRSIRQEGIVDTKPFEDLRKRWKEMDDRKKQNPLSPEEETAYRKLSQDLVNTWQILKRTYVDKLVVRDAFTKGVSGWFVLPGGEELQRAYEEFREIQKKDIEARLKKWDDNSFTKEREEAEQRFMTIYKKMASVRLAEHVKAYDEEIPPQNLVGGSGEEGGEEKKRQPDFASILGKVINTGMKIKIPFTDVEFTPNMMKMGDAIGMDKARAYEDGSFVPGQDLYDPVEEQPGLQEQQPQ